MSVRASNPRRRAPGSGAGWAIAAITLMALQVAPAVSNGQLPELPESHRRMQEALAEIAPTVPDGDFFADKVPSLEAGLAALPADAPMDDRIRLLGELGQAYLGAGEAELAAEILGQVEQRLLSLAQPPRGLLVTTLFLLGVTQMRMGQDANCIEGETARRCILPIRSADTFVVREPAQRAAQYFVRVVNAAPPEHPIGIAARWLLNLVAMFLGDYPERLPAAYRIDPAVFQPPLAGPFPRFEEVAHAVGLDSMSQAGGSVVDDFDGDGLYDVLVSNLVPSAPLRLLLNDGRGGFVDASAEQGAPGITGGLNLVPADYDNDGDLDVYITRGAWMADEGRWPNSLLRNDDGRLVDVTTDVGLDDVRTPTQTAAWADYDLDGDLDLYVGNETLAGSVYASQLFENRDGRFVDVAVDAGVASYGFTKAVAWGDYDADGDADLFVSNLGGPNKLYQNRGDGTFRDVARRLGVDEPIFSFVPWFWDVNNDGHLDLLVNAYRGVFRPGDAPSVWYVAAARLGRPNPGHTPSLFLGDGDGGFREVTEAWGLATPTLPMGANFGDLDNDGYPDFYLGTGYPGLEALMPNVMYRNVRGERFEEVTFAGGFGHLGKGHGIAFADLDDDGDQDVFIQMGGMRPNDAAPDALFENPGFGNRWLKLELDGAGRTAWGTRVEVRISEGEAQRAVFAWHSQQGSFGYRPRRLEIGLGTATRIDELRVRWPGAGEDDVFRDVELDRFYELRRGDGELRERPLTPFRLGTRRPPRTGA